ncbi:hypothetical protein [Marimonas arenosa]|uniref:Uncharacterized protein n=1 Tax=Marimonas arenosa TaxID=1795305 RepID=A0AAE3WFG4_9RHOB|nr:hypothetical protein [Marimonas arenosa]MDQ2090715.1 hypothetical protein [Marimonas arenosa]
MVNRVFITAFLVLALALSGGPGGPTAVHADGGDGGGFSDDQPRPRGSGASDGSDTGMTNAPAAPQQPRAQTAPRGAGPCINYKQSRLREVRDIQSKIAGYAKKDKLKGLATTKKRLENFVSQINKMGDSYSGWKSIEFNLIFQQMQCYANQKQDKALRKWARGILRAFEVIKLRNIAETKRAKVKKAIAEKNPLTEAFARAEYSDARGDYHRAAKKLPPEMRAKFDPMPKDPGK